MQKEGDLGVHPHDDGGSTILALFFRNPSNAVEDSFGVRY